MITLMNRDQAIEKLRLHEAELKNMGVKSLYLFGSTARGEARPDSDVDLFYEYEIGAIGLRELFQIKDAAERFLGCKTDIMPRDGINKYVRPHAEDDAIQVF